MRLSLKSAVFTSSLVLVMGYNNGFAGVAPPPGPPSLDAVDLASKSVIGSVTPEQLAELLAGSGVSVSNVNFTGAFGPPSSGGAFVGGISSGIGIESGVVLTSGSVINAFGPNDDDGTSTDNGLPGSALLDQFIGELGLGEPDDFLLVQAIIIGLGLDEGGDSLFGLTLEELLAEIGEDPLDIPDLLALDPPDLLGELGIDPGILGELGFIEEISTFDATILAFDFIPEGNQVEFNYVFASEEYEEFVDSGFNDVFGFFVNGTNFAVVPGTTEPVAINNVNQNTNSAFYLSNSPVGLGPFDHEYDGQTTVLQLIAPVNPGVVNTMLLGIADAGDEIYDSAAFIEGGTFSSDIIDGTPVGATPRDPFMPTGGSEGGGFFFDGFVPLPGLTFFDPIVSVGYDYEITAGPNFSSVVLPSFDDNLYDLSLWDGSQYVFDQVLTAGVEHFFDPGGVDRFRIEGIDISNMLDPNDPLAFVTGLSFESNAAVSFSMDPLTVETQPVPEPGTFVLLGSGLIGLLGYTRTQRRKEAA